MNTFTKLLVGAGIAGATLLGATAPAMAADTASGIQVTATAGDRISGKLIYSYTHSSGELYYPHTATGVGGAFTRSLDEAQRLAANFTLPAPGGAAGPIVSEDGRCYEAASVVRPVSLTECNGSTGQKWTVIGDHIRSTLRPDMYLTNNGSTYYPTLNPTSSGFLMGELSPVVDADPVAFTGATNAPFPVFSGTGDAGATITLTLPDGTVLATVTVGADGSWSVPSIIELAPGSHNVTATQTGGGRTPSTDMRTVVVDAPVVAPVAFTGATTDPFPAFTGTGEAGATITITLPDGTVLATTTVNPDGTWTVPSSVELADGDYRVTATQTGTGLPESSDTITVTIVGAPIADPMIAGGAGVALLAGAGAVIAIRRRRAAQAQA